MKPKLGTDGPNAFLEQCWQRKPRLFRQAYPGFEPELDANDLAGLACEEGVEARLVSGSYPAHDWTLRYGPFRESELESLPPSGWTLLVQDVEKHYPPLRTLLDGFDFIPSWRVDDLMVSVAAPGGSVGPHVDQYDVFLLQAAGRRRWQIAGEFDPELLPDSPLNVLRHFEPGQEWVLEPGDMLYLPPGVAHHGVAIDTGMTWSIGLRAPSAADLLQAFGEWLATNRDEGPRYRDGRLGQADRYCLDSTSTGRFRHLLDDVLDSPDFAAFLGDFLSQYRMAHRPAPPPDRFTAERIRSALQSGELLRHNPWTRMLWRESSAGEEAAILHAQGDHFSCSAGHARRLCDAGELERLTPDCNPDLLEVVGQLLDKGHLYFEAV
jgi:50S ribosomal protein L16 3-hydroxylase